MEAQARDLGGGDCRGGRGRGATGGARKGASITEHHME